MARPVNFDDFRIYYTTKTFVKAKVEPVLKRADSVKQLAMLDDALSVADKYVDKYLPDKDPGEDVPDKTSTKPSSQAVKTIQHVNHFSRKLQRRLTRRTIAEAKLLKKQGYDTVQCFLYFADLLAKDPQAFAEKMKAIWKHLSEDEPENQKPPENIEQLIEMLSREGARRFVHVTNFVVKNVYMSPTHARQAFTYATHEAALLADRIIKYAHLEKAKSTIVEVSHEQMAKYKKFVDDLKKMILEYLSFLTLILNESKKTETDKDKKNDPKANSKSPKDEKTNVPASTPVAAPVNTTTNAKKHQS